MSWMPNVWQQEFCQEIIPTMDLTQSTLKELHLSLRADTDVEISEAKVRNHVELVIFSEFKFFKPVWKHLNKSNHQDVVYRTLVSLYIVAVPHTGISEWWWTYLENFHGQLAHNNMAEERCAMDSVLGAVVQEVAGSPFSVLPALLTLVVDKHRLLLEPDLWCHSRQRGRSLGALVEAAQVWGSTEDPSPPKGKYRRVELNKPG